MKTAIRYYSKFGHTTKMANIVGELTNTRPELATVRLKEPVDTLYLGAGVFLGKVDNSIVEFINTLTPDMVKCVWSASVRVPSSSRPFHRCARCFRHVASPSPTRSSLAAALWGPSTWDIPT